MVLFKNPRDCRQVEYLANQIYTKTTKKGIIESFQDATDQPYGYLLVDLKQDTPACLRLRANILETPQTVYVLKGIKVSDELSPTHNNHASLH